MSTSSGANSAAAGRITCSRQPELPIGAREHGQIQRIAESVAPIAKDLGRAVAVMDVEVEYEHALHAEFGDRVLRCDRDVVEQAEAHRPRTLGVMTRRAHR